MRWLSENWIWLVAVGGMLWMHLGMHRGHGGHGDRSGEPAHAGHGPPAATAWAEAPATPRHRHPGG